VYINDLLASGEIPDLFAQVRAPLLIPTFPSVVHGWGLYSLQTCIHFQKLPAAATHCAAAPSAHSNPNCCIVLQEDRDEIINAMRGETKSLGLLDTADNCWATFINKVKTNLHVAFTASPVGEAFRVRSQVRL